MHRIFLLLLLLPALALAQTVQPPKPVTGGVSSFATRTGAVTPLAGDYSAFFQPLDGDLTTWAGLTPSANAQSLVTAANYAAMRGLLGLATVAATGAFGDLSGKPTTLGGYGLTDAVANTTTVNGHALSANVTVTLSDLGLGNVENTRLSTWPGSANVSTLGTITLGTWHGTALADAYIASAATWNAKQSALTFGAGLTNTGGTITVGSAAITNAMLAGSIDPAKVTGTAATLGANSFTGAQTTPSLTVAGGSELHCNVFIRQVSDDYPFYQFAADGAVFRNSLTISSGYPLLAQGTLNVSGASTTTKHLIGGSTVPTLAAGTGAGTSPIVSVTGTDLGFTLSVTTGTLPTLAGVVATVTFNSAYGSAPHFSLTPSNANAALLTGATMVVPSATTSTFFLTAGATALTAATTYTWEISGLVQ